jgi:hypothetical protein
MNEFIVWDKKSKIFHYAYIARGILHHDRLVDFTNNLEVFNYIGKTDIEGNKIYADSSIVEFSIFKDNDLEIFPDKETMKGYFTFNSNSLSYSIRTLDDSHENFDFISVHNRIVDLKIIDTLQENKKLLT